MTAAPRGFSLFELVIITGFLAAFLILAGLEVRFGMRSSAMTAGGALELTLAVRAAEAFRNDVRGAASAVVSQDGSTVRLRTRSGVVEYSRARDGRLSRVDSAAAAGADPAGCTAGPLLSRLYFRLDTPPVRGAALRLLRARWVCAAGAAAGNRQDQAALPAGRTLVLDTALRATETEVPGP